VGFGRQLASEGRDPEDKFGRERRRYVRSMQRRVARRWMALRQGEAFPQHVHRAITGILFCEAKTCCTFLHRLGMISPQPVGFPSLSGP
jgi:hypothetical protein